MYWSMRTLSKASLSRRGTDAFAPGSRVADLGVEDGTLEVTTAESDPGASLDDPAAVAGVAAMADEQDVPE